MRIMRIYVIRPTKSDYTLSAKFTIGCTQDRLNELQQIAHNFLAGTFLDQNVRVIYITLAYPELQLALHFHTVSCLEIA